MKHSLFSRLLMRPPPQMHTRATTHQRNMLPWIGGSLFGATEILQQLSITRVDDLKQAGHIALDLLEGEA